ncbi:MAG: hypothetical protein IH989_00200 [Planctomycetes bacterium]|nr:hypothetical protein [Planctomycetota bacterium]
MRKKVLTLVSLSLLAVASMVWTSRAEADGGEAKYVRCIMAETCCGFCK